MKKHIIIVILLLTIILSLVLTSCNKPVEITITFDSQGGTAVAPITIKNDSDLTIPEAPTKEGYTFIGWFLDQELQDALESGTIKSLKPKEDITVYAKWQINQYTITFESNGGSVVASITQDYGTDVAAPAAPTKEGYTFAGWFSDNTTFANTYTFTSMPLDGITLYAKWTPVQYAITFESNGGSVVAPITQGFGTAVSTPQAPTKDGYTFGGWFADNNTFQNSYTFTTMPLNGITLYAKWTLNQYTITFESNGGSVVAPITQDYGTAVAGPQAPTKDGCTFDGWFTDNGTFQNAYTFTTMPLDGITLYAKWTPNPCTIAFESNGGSPVAPITQEYGTAVAAPAAPTRDGYTFGGWFTDNGTFRNAYTFTTMPLEGITLYAKWTPNPCTIAFESNGGSPVAPITQEFGTAVAAPAAPTRDGYTFGGWFTDNDTFQNSYTFTTMPLNGITLYAKWTPNQCTITFETNGGSAIAPITQNFGTVVSAPQAPTKDGYTFGGWFTDNNTFQNAYTFTTMPLDGIMLYAKWTPVQYTITFETNGGSAVAAIIQGYGTEVTAPQAPTKDGYAFGGWFTDNDTFQNAYTFTTMPLNGITLYAKWTPVQYTISFETNGGSAVAAIIQGYGTEVTAPQAPTKDGHTFGGWFTDNDTFQNAYTFTTMPLNGITLYAKWTLNQYNITFESNGGSAVAPITQLYGSDITAPEDPERGGYIFTGWYADEACTEEFIFDTMPAGITLYAGWIDTLKKLHNEKNAAFTHYFKENLFYLNDLEDIIYVWEESRATEILIYNPISMIFGADFIGFNFSSEEEAAEVAKIWKLIYNYEELTVRGTCTYRQSKGKLEFLLDNTYVDDGVIYLKKGDHYSVLTYCLYDNSEPRHIEILSEIDNLPVTSISADAFVNYSSFSITLPASIETIGAYAFYGSWLEEITIPENSNLKSIGESAFEMTPLTNFKVPASLISIEKFAFYLSSLETLEVPGDSNLRYIGYGAFDFTPWFDNQDDGVLYIGRVAHCYIGDEPVDYELILREDTLSVTPGAFCDRYNIISIVLNEGLEIIGENAFYYTYVDDIHIPESVKEIGDCPFTISAISVHPDNQFFKAENNVLFNKSGTRLIGFYDKTLETYTVPNTVTEIAPCAFVDNSLTEIILPSSLTRIGYGAFEHCAFTDLIIPASVTYIGEYAFYNTDLETVTIEDNSQLTELADSAFGECEYLSSFDFGDNSSLTYIAQSAFMDCISLSGIIIPDGVKEIGNDAFAMCYSLSFISLPDSLEVIGDAAFNYCENLAAIHLPSGLLSIGSYAFSYSDLTSITLPSSLRVLGNNAFAYCYSLETVVFKAGCQVRTLLNETFYYCTTLSSITLPDSLEIIESRTFAYCSFLSGVSLPDGLKLIDEYAFRSSALMSITIPAGVTQIGMYTFADCLFLQTVNFEGDIKQIGSYAFNKCIRLKTINGDNTLPSGLNYIGSNAFAECSELQKIVIPSSVLVIGVQAFYKTGISDLSLPEADVYMETEAFGQNNNLETLFIPAEIRAIANYAFCNCANLKNLTFEEGSALDYIGLAAFSGTQIVSLILPGVRYIGILAFYNIESLTSLTIGEGLEKLDNMAFGSCNNLANIVLPDSLYYISTNVFSEISVWYSNMPDGPVYAGKVLYRYKTSNSPDTELTSLVIAEGTTGLAADCLKDLHGLTELTIPASVKHIVSSAIFGCKYITRINMVRSYALDGGITEIDNNFIIDYHNDLEIHVPTDSYPYYINSQNWSAYIQRTIYDGFCVDFNLTGGTSIGDIDSQFIEPGAKAVEPAETITKAGYSFVGWYTDPSDGELYDFNAPVTADFSLYARYEVDLRQFTVTFNTMGGDKADPITCEYNQGFYAYNYIPYKSGFRLESWYFDEEYTQPVPNMIAVLSDITLYAKWDPNDGLDFDTPMPMSSGKITVLSGDDIYYFIESETDITLSFTSLPIIRGWPEIFIYSFGGVMLDNVRKDNYFAYTATLQLEAGLYIIEIFNLADFEFEFEITIN